MLEFLTDDQRPEAALQGKTELHQHSRAYAYYLVMAALPISYWLRDTSRIRASLEDLSRFAEDEVAPLWKPVLQFYGAVVGHLDGRTDCLTEMRDLVDGLLRDGFHRRSSLYLAIVAETALDLGETGVAAEAIARAYEQQNRCPEVWHVPELMRIEAGLAASLGQADKASALLKQAGHKAREMDLRYFHRCVQRDHDALEHAAGARNDMSFASS